MENSLRISIGKPEGKRNMQDQGVDERILSRWMLSKWGLMLLTGFIWFIIGSSGSGEHGNEP
jgi:hypothetical protein